jgi:AcrR family transcriptional regulator
MQDISISNRQLEIINAAGKIITSSGINSLTIKNLGKEMNFSEGAIYRHFKSKQEIILVMLSYLAVTLDEIYTKSYETYNTPLEKLAQLTQHKFLFFKEHPHFVTVIFSDGLFDNSLEVNKAIQVIMKTKVKHLKPIIEELQEDGTFSKVLTIEETMHILMGSLRLQMFKWKASKFSFDIMKAINLRFKNIITLLKN